MSWRTLTREQKDEANRRNRERYANNPALRKLFNGYAQARWRTPQGRLERTVRQCTVRWRGRYEPIHARFMEACTGMTREEFTTQFGDAEETDHIVPLTAFDLTNWQHLVRAVDPSNLQHSNHLENLVKSNKVEQGLCVIELPWAGTELAMWEAQKFIDGIKRKMSNKI